MAEDRRAENAKLRQQEWDLGPFSSLEPTAAEQTEALKLEDWAYPADFFNCDEPKVAEGETAFAPGGCGGEGVRGIYRPIPKEQITKQWNICVLHPHLKDPWWVAANYGFFTEAKRAGVKMTVLEAGGYPNIRTQIDQVDNCVASGADAVVLAAVSFEGLNAKVEEMVDRGIVVIDHANGWTTPAGEPFVGHGLENYYYLGEGVGTYLASKNEPLKVAWFPGPPGTGWAASADEGFKDAIKGSQVEVLVTRFGDTGKDVQLDLVQNALTAYQDIDYIAGTAVTTDAAAPLLLALGRADETKTAAEYMIPTSYEALKEGALDCAMTDQPVLQARFSLDMAVRALEGLPFHHGYARVGPVPQLVCADTLETDFVFDGTFAPPGYRPVFNIG